MQSPNSMIVRGQALPAPPATLQRFFGGRKPDTSRRLSVAGQEGRFVLHAESSPFLTVGRSDDCDIQLCHADVSYRHAHLQLVAGHVYCIDLASRTGTFWDGISRPSGWLMPGDSVRIGPYSIVVDDGLADETDRQVTELNLLSHEVADPQIELEFLNGRHIASSKKSRQVRQPITLIGSSPQCRLRLKDDSVSRVHCSLMATPSGVWVTDLLGRGGTRVNGEPVTFRLLNHNDQLGIGRFRFGIRYRDGADGDESPSPIPPPTSAVPHERRHQPAEGAAGVSEGFVISMMDRFAEMQQQMSAINHQQMMFMAQLVGSMHQNHHDLAQRELAHIAELGAEIRKLQNEAASQGLALPSSPSPAGAAADLIGIPMKPTVPENRLESPLPDQSTLHGFPDDTASPSGVPAADPLKAPRHTQRDVNSHSHLIERMADLEKERNSRWKKLVSLLTGSGP